MFASNIGSLAFANIQIKIRNNSFLLKIIRTFVPKSGIFPYILNKM